MKRRNKEMELNDNPRYRKASPGSGGVREDSSTRCGGGWGWGRQVPQKDGESFTLISPAAFCSVYLQKKKEKKKKNSFNLVEGPTLTHLSGIILVISVFSLTTWPQGHSGLVEQSHVYPGPVCFLGYFTKLVTQWCIQRKGRKTVV
uniref:Mono-ADP ribosylhydrolase 2 n=1 Tax=Macaca fascicularis TaxID=9541 RepID=A0A7N9DH44_MACFA